MNSFDDLFNMFFGRNRKDEDSNKPENENKTNDFDSKVKSLIDSLAKFSEISEGQSEKIEDKFGDPDKIERFEKDGLFFERRTWKLGNGVVEKLLVSDEPFEDEITLTLEEQLEQAVANEEFEKAAELRDLISQGKK